MAKYVEHGFVSTPQRGEVGLVQYHQPKAAEYPFHTNLCMPPQGVNFDLTHKRGKISNLICSTPISIRGLRNYVFNISRLSTN